MWLPLLLLLLLLLLLVLMMLYRQHFYLCLIDPRHELRLLQVAAVVLAAMAAAVAVLVTVPTRPNVTGTALRRLNLVALHLSAGSHPRQQQMTHAQCQADR